MADNALRTHQLVGRDRELATLETFLDDTIGQGSTLLLTGEPGVGKTALLDAVAESASGRGARVIRGSGVEYETDVSFAGLHQLLDPLSRDLSSLPRASRAALEAALGLGSGPVPDRLTVLNASLALFRASAADAPLLIIIDDLHWLDRASGAVVGFVGRRLHGSRIRLLGATRPGVGGFVERTGLSELDVEPLAGSDALELLARRFAHLPTRVRQRVVDDAQGNPLALLEFAGSASNPDIGARSTLGPGREVRALFQARVDSLPDDTRALLLLAALDGSGSLGVLAAASEPGGLKALGIAERDHLVVVDDQRSELSFRHPMIKSVVVERSTLDERRAAHQRLADVFVDQVERRGHHLAEAAFAPDESVAAAIEEGAHHTLRRGDVVGAISRFVRAADLSPDRTDRSLRLAEAAYVGVHAAGQLDSSTKLLREAQREDPLLGDTLQASVATAYLLLNGDGNAETAHRLLTVALESAVDKPHEARDGLSEVLYTLVLVCHYAGRSEFWTSFHQTMDRLGEKAPKEVLLLAKILADPMTASAQALSDLDHEIDRLKSSEELELMVRTAIAGFYADRLTACRASLLRVVDDGRHGGADGLATMALNMLAFEDYGAGRWDAAHEAAVETTSLWEERGYQLFACSGRYPMALLAGNRGDRAACQQICGAIIEWAAPRQLSLLEDYANHALAQAALGDSDFETAYRHATAISTPGTLRSHAPQALLSALDLLDSALHTKRDAEARAHARALRKADVGRLSPRLALFVAAADAMTAPDDEAPERYREALAIPEVESWPFEIARVQLLFGERLRRLRLTRQARSVLTAARDGFDRLGALSWSRRATTELAATGATRRAHRGGGPASLTPQEREVADLAAQGLTNQQIAGRLYVSPRTVSAHLYSVFPKLGISSRAGLRDALTATPQDPDPTSLR